MKCHMVFLSGPRTGEAIDFDAARITIGRASDCDLQFDPYTELAVASRHAEILLDEDTHAFCLYDAGSRSGTFVNGHKIRQKQPLRHEDYLQFGKNGPEVIFRRGLAPEGPQPMPPKPPESGELEFLVGADTGKVFPVLGDRVTRVGRRSDLEIPLDPRGDMVVSGNHCGITWEDGSFILTDTSRNGTFINGAQVSGAAYLNDGDVVTLGEEGPRAKFTVHPVQRIYPNLDESFPQPEPEVEPEASAAPAPAPVLQSRPEPAHAVAPTPQDMPVSAIQQPLPDAQPITIPSMPSMPPRPPMGVILAGAARRAWKTAHSHPRGAIVAITTIVILLVIVISVSRRSATQQQAPLAGGTPGYTAEITAGAAREVDQGHYTAIVPRGWEAREDNAMLSAESQDKKVTVDYVRDPRLTEKAVADIFAGKNMQAKPISAKSRQNPVHASIGQGAKNSAMAVLHSPDGDVPVLALLEADTEVFNKIPDDVMRSLLIDKVAIKRLQAKPVAPPPTPPPTPGPAIAAATPPPTPETTPEPTPAPTPEPSPAATAAPSPSPTKVATPLATLVQSSQTPEPKPSPTATPPPRFTSKALGVEFDVPAGWKATEDAADKVVRVSSPKGMSVRITRDASALEPEPVFSAMTDDGWVVKRQSEKNTVKPGYDWTHSIMTKPGKNLMLLLLSTPSKETLVFYATQKEEFAPADWREVANLAGQIARNSE